MAFTSFDDLARVGLKRPSVVGATILIRTDRQEGKRAATIFRFGSELVDKAGWKPGADRIELQIDTLDRVIKARRTISGGYKLIGPASGNPYVKFSVAAGMPIARSACQASDVVVAGGELMFVLPDEVGVFCVGQ